MDLKSNHCSKILYGQIVISRAEFNNRHSNFFNIYWNCFYSNANILNLAIHAKFLDQDSNCGHPCKSFESCFKLRDKNFHLGNILSLQLCLFLKLFASCKNVFKTNVSFIEFYLNLTNFLNLKMSLINLIYFANLTTICHRIYLNFLSMFLKN